MAECLGDHDFEQIHIESAVAQAPKYAGMVMYCRVCGVGYLVEMRPESIEHPFSMERRVYLRLFPSEPDLHPSSTFTTFAMVDTELRIAKMESDGYTIHARDPTSGPYARSRLERLNGASEPWGCGTCGHAPADHDQFDGECLTCDCPAML